MARLQTIKFLRTTRAALDAQASGAGLLEGEPYLITDEDLLAVGLTTSTYAEFVKPPPSNGNYYAWKDGAWVDISDKIIDA